jgi:hypothetical protein
MEEDLSEPMFGQIDGVSRDRPPAVRQFADTWGRRVLMSGQRQAREGEGEGAGKAGDGRWGLKS